MQSLFVAAAVSALLCSSLVYSALPEKVAVCMEKNGVTKDDLIAWKDEGIASDGLKCNFKCMMLSYATMTEDGKLLCEPMLEKMPPEHHAAVKECCDIEQGGELCDLAFRHNQCLRDKMPEFYKQMMAMKISLMSA